MVGEGGNGLVDDVSFVTGGYEDSDGNGFLFSFCFVGRFLFCWEVGIFCGGGKFGKGEEIESGREGEDKVAEGNDWE